LPAGAADLQPGDRPGGIDQERQILAATDGLSIDADDDIAAFDALAGGCAARHDSHHLREPSSPGFDAQAAWTFW